MKFCALFASWYARMEDKQEQAMIATDGTLHCTVGLATPMEFGLPWYSHIILRGFYFAQFVHSVARQHALRLHGDPLTDHRVFAGVCTIPGQQVARAELCTTTLSLSHRCCSGPHCVSFSLCASLGHPPGLHQPWQHVRGTASGHWSDKTLQGRAGHCMRQLLCDNIARLPQWRWNRRFFRQPGKEPETHSH